MSALFELKRLLAEAAAEQKNTIETPIVQNELSTLQEPLVTTNEETIVQRAARYLENRGPSITENSSIEKQRWNDPLRVTNQTGFVTFKEMNEHYGLFLQRIQQQLASLGGGGEVRLQRLDDVNYLTIADDRFLQYDAASKKFIFVKLDDDYTTRLNSDNTISVINLPNDVIGPVQGFIFDTTHVHTTKDPGTLCWNSEDDTLNIQHTNGVVQQVGQELYAFVRNRTANTIVEGTVVRFDGAEENGTSRLLVAPFLGDGTFPNLYGLGVLTEDIEPGNDGRATVWGKVRGLDTSVWNVGDILYVSTTIPGGLTNVKPTAPNNVIPIAAVLRKDATEGEIFVRPTIEQGQYYGRFSRLTDQTAANADQGYAVQFDTIEISNGVVFNGVSNTEIKVTDSGFYQFDISAQVTATSNKGRVYFWLNKNGTPIPHTTRLTTITNGDTFNVSTTIALSLNVNDYIEIMWSRSADGIFLDARDATAYAPSAAAVVLNVVQVQL
jgi:hypothetical protein